MNDPESIQAFIVDPDNLPERSSKDVLKIFYRGSFKSPIEYASGASATYKYAVKNQTKIDKLLPDFKHEVELRKNKSGDMIATCSCPARKICKHIIEVIKLHRIAFTVGYIPK